MSKVRALLLEKFRREAILNFSIEYILESILVNRELSSNTKLKP